MEDKKIKQEIDINKFVSYMEHPTNEEIKKEIETGLKSKNIPDEIKEQIKTKFYNIEDKNKDYGEEYDRYLVNLLVKKRKDFKYLQAIFLIINNIEKNRILKKEGIVPNYTNKAVNKNDVEIDEDWYIDIQIDLVYNDNNYYHKYVKKIVNELFSLLNKEFLSEYIKLDYTKKGESYYKNNKEDFLSSIIALFEKLNSLTKIVDKNETKRKKKNRKKNKNKNVSNINTNNNSEINENNNDNNNNNENNNNDNNNDNNNNDNNNIININNKKDQIIKNDNVNINQANISNMNNINNISNNININEKKEIKNENENNNKIIDNQNKPDNKKNKIWVDNLKLNREELKLVNDINDKSLKNEISLSKSNKLELSDKCLDLDLLSKIEIEKKFINLENQINDLKNQNKAQSNQVSQFKEEMVKMQKENEILKNELNNIKLFTHIYILKKKNSFILKKILDKYHDKLEVKKEGENPIFNFNEDIKDIKVSELNTFIQKIYNNVCENDSIVKNIMNNLDNEFNKDKIYENIIDKLLNKEEMNEFNFFEEDIHIKNYIISKFDLK